MFDRVKPGSRVLDIGCGPGYVAEELSKIGIKTVSIDRYITDSAKKYSADTIQADVEKFDFAQAPSVDTILLLDIIEHLREPEGLLKKIRSRFGKEMPEVIISTGNVAFFPIRFMLLLGQFNYGKRGILDIDHTRLFTSKSLKRVLINQGYEIVHEMGIPAPFPLVFGERRLSYVILKI